MLIMWTLHLMTLFKILIEGLVLKHTVMVVEVLLVCFVCTDTAEEFLTFLGKEFA